MFNAWNAKHKFGKNMYHGNELVILIKQYNNIFYFRYKMTITNKYNLNYNLK